MSPPETPARSAARRAAQAAGVEIRAAGTLYLQARLGSLFDEVWDAPPGCPVVPANLLRAAEHAGGPLAVAFAGDDAVGGSFGLLARHEGRLAVHSHMTGVVPGLHGRGVGFALKLDQRAWAIESGIDVVVWTFDPLVRHNARFNLGRLGAKIVEYHENFYGEMRDGINAGDVSDRVLVRWDLHDDSVQRAAEGARRPPEESSAGLRDAAVLLAADGSVREPGGEPVALIATPEDAVALRRADRASADRWRMALRAAFLSALAAGYRPVGITTAGSYVLERDA